MATQYLGISIDVWAERGESEIRVDHAYWGDEIARWRNEDLRAMFDEGYFKGAMLPQALGTWTADAKLCESIWLYLLNRQRAPEFFECGNCGANGFYVSTFCNFAHCACCGYSVDEDHSDCYINPLALHYEMHAKFNEPGKWRCLNGDQRPDIEACKDCGNRIYFD
jgi:hypothetical protein